MTEPHHPSVDMRPPQHLFGFPARWRAGVTPAVVGDLMIGAFRLKRLRWECNDVELDGFDMPSDGHVVTYLVASDGRQRMLSQQHSSFFQEEDAPPPSRLRKRIAQGDGRSTPWWHKSDRQWPAEDSQAFDFIGQGYFEGEVVYLFKHPSSDRVAVFADELARQDAEAHYSEEGARTRQ